MNLDRFEIWHNVPREDTIRAGAFPLVNSQLVLYDTETKKPFKIATRCVIELAAGGLPKVVGLEVLDVDENGRQRREGREGKVIRYGTLDVDEVQIAAENLVEQITKRAESAAIHAVLEPAPPTCDPAQCETDGPFLARDGQPVSLASERGILFADTKRYGFRVRADGEHVLSLNVTGGDVESITELPPDGKDL